MTDQLDVKKCVDELIQRLNVPDELPKYVLSPLQVELFKKHLGVFDTAELAHAAHVDAKSHSRDGVGRLKGGAK